MGDWLASGVGALAGVVLGPLLVGIVQWLKARLQGRRGAPAWQPYLELRRLIGKSAVEPEGATAIYRATPPLIAAAHLVAVLLVPIGALGLDGPIGHDALALAGLLALARAAAALSSFDVGSGFALMGASRELALAVFVEAALAAALVGAAVVAGTTDLRGMIAGTAGSAPWTSPALGLAAVAFLLVVIAETGRQPVDNPDTHLELTMIEEGPLLEYAGRDLALLQWAAATRHWLVLVVAATVFLPHPSGAAAQLALLPVALLVLCGALAATETAVAKMRILLVPRLLAVGVALAVLGVATALVEGRG